MEEKSMETAKPLVKNWEQCDLVFWSQGYAILRLTCSFDGVSKFVHVHLLSKQKTADGVLLVFKLAGTLLQAFVTSDDHVSINGQVPKRYSSAQIQKTIIPAKSIPSPEESFLPPQYAKIAVEPSLNSPLAGRVLTVVVAVGQAVKKNQPLLIVESMKMENEICSPYDAIIKTLLIKPGDLVQPNQRLIRFFLGEGVSDATAAHGHEQKEVSYR